MQDMKQPNPIFEWFNQRLHLTDLKAVAEAARSARAIMDLDMMMMGLRARGGVYYAYVAVRVGPASGFTTAKSSAVARRAE